MSDGRKKYSAAFVAAGLYFFSQAAYAVLFEPGVGLGLEYTDNARLTSDDQLNDLIAATYLGARVSESEGTLQYEAAASFNKHNYTKDSYPDQKYFNLGASADWEMIKERFSWFISDTFYQEPIFTLESNTPDNLQDSNIFTFGANIRIPVSARQSFSLVPMFSQYYYEVLVTDNKQYSLSANWSYQMFRRANVGLNLSARKINYTEENFLGQSIEDTTFTTLGFTFDLLRARSSLSGNLGSTNVKRENGDETSGFSGFLNWTADLSSRSKFETLFSSELTDTSTVAASINDNNIQITADVIRASIINLAYSRDDAALNSRISAQYNSIDYSDSPLDRIIRDFDLVFTYPVTQLILSGAYINYGRIKELDTDRLDERFTVGGNLRYNFSRKVHGIFDIKYRKKESTFAPENYDEFSVFVSLVYGFGDVLRPSRAGGY